MADGDAGRCEPYRAEWRRHLTSGWMVLGKCDTLGEAEAKAQRAVRDYTGGQARVLEQRVVLVRGLGQDGGPDQAFVEWQHMQPPPFRVEMRHRSGCWDCGRQIGHWSDHASGCPVGEGFRRAERSVVSDPDDRRDVEAAADAGQPMAPRWFGSEHKVRDATVTDMAGCVHRMSSGAVSLTACGECGADPGDDCADELGDRERWAIEHTDITSVTVNDVRRANAAIRQGLLTVVTAHRDLDDFGVPRHLPAEPEQQTADDERRGAPK